MSESFQAGDDDGGFGDIFTADWFRDRLLLEIDQPWAGCTESGFGQSSQITLSRADTERLRDWLSASLSLPQPPAQEGGT